MGTKKAKGRGWVKDDPPFQQAKTQKSPMIVGWVKPPYRITA